MVQALRGFNVITEHGLERAFERAGAFGFDYVEIPMNEFDRDWLAENDTGIEGLVDTNGVDFMVHLPFGGSDAAIGSSDESVRRQVVSEMKENVRGASDLGAEKGVLHVETDESDHLSELGRDEELWETVRELAAFAGDHGFELCAENLPERYPRLSDLQTLVRETPVSLTIDTGHARVNGNDESDIAEFVGDHADRISHFHLNDVRGPEDEHLPFGAGDTDFAAIFDRLPEDWGGTMTCEINTLDYDYIEISGRKLDALL